MKETDIGVAVVTWLQQSHWTVYQEVQMGRGEPIADIVATQGHLVWVVSCKRSLGLAVLEQAAWWHQWAHHVSVAVARPLTRRRVRGRDLASRVMEWLGIGWISVGCGGVEVRIPPRLRRRAMTQYLRESLCEEQKTWCAAGTAGGGYYTPFTQTRRNLIAFVTKRPGCTLKEAIEGIDHHYAHDTSAKGCLAQWIGTGVIPEIQRDTTKRPYRLYLTTETNP